jgi:hypothetical protein
VSAGTGTLAGLLCAVLGLATCAPAAAADPSFYSPEDFARVAKVDAHMHIHGPADHLMAQAIADRFRILTIDVDYPDYPPIKTQERDAV